MCRNFGTICTRQGSPNPESTAWNPESKTVFGFLYMTLHGAMCDSCDGHSPRWRPIKLNGLKYTVWHEIFAGVYLCGLSIFCVLRELIFATRKDWFFLLGINFCHFQKVPSTQHWQYFRFYWVRAIEMHIFKQYYGVRQYFFIYRFVSLRKRQAVIEQTRFLDTVFLCSEFRLEYPGVNFCGKNLCDNFYLRELNFCGSLKKKIRKNRKN